MTMNYVAFHDENWTWLKFPAKPPEDVRERMKAQLGARWGRRKQSWYVRDQLVPVETLTEVVGNEPLTLIEGRAPTRTWEYCEELAMQQLGLFGDAVTVQVEPPANGKLAARLRAMAGKLAAQIEDKRRPMTQNPTPRRMRMYQQRLHEANDLERAQKAMLALAEAHESGSVPSILAGVRTKKEALELVRTRHGSDGGYYSYYDSGEFADASEKGKALQALIGDLAEAQRRETAVQRLEAKARLLVGQVPGFFPTPEPIARQMVGWAGVEAGMRVLEPSAGSGAIADVIREECPGADLEVIEYNLTLCELLDAKGYAVVGDDFFGVDGQRWDRIVQNPPFEGLQDVDHVRWAYEHLADGGRLVSVMSESPFFRKDKKAAAFREWLDELDHEVVDLPTGAFQESGTGVKARIVVIDR